MSLTPFTQRMGFDPWFPRTLNESSNLFDSFFGLGPSYPLASQDLSHPDLRMEVFGGQEIKRNDDGSLDISIDIPGVKKEDVSVKVEEGVLSISATRSSDVEEKNDKGELVTTRRTRGAVHRSWTLPEGITPSDIQAKNENGVLKIGVPKPPALMEKPAVHMIDIK